MTWTSLSAKLEDGDLLGDDHAASSRTRRRTPPPDISRECFGHALFRYLTSMCSSCHAQLHKWQSGWPSAVGDTGPYRQEQVCHGVGGVGGHAAFAV